MSLLFRDPPPITSASRHPQTTRLVKEVAFSETGRGSHSRWAEAWNGTKPLRVFFRRLTSITAVFRFLLLTFRCYPFSERAARGLPSRVCSRGRRALPLGSTRGPSGEERSRSLVIDSRSESITKKLTEADPRGTTSRVGPPFLASF